MNTVLVVSLLASFVVIAVPDDSGDDSMETFNACAHDPTLELLVTGGRDAVARVWDVRTKKIKHGIRTEAVQYLQPRVGYLVPDQWMR